MAKTFESDGPNDTPQVMGADIKHYPFLNLGNQDAYIIERYVECKMSGFTTPTLGTEATEADGGDSAAGDSLYLIDESPLDPGMSGVGIARTSRLWAPEMSDHVRYGYVTLSLPDFRGLSYDPGTGPVEPTYNESQRSIEIPLGTDLTISSSQRYFTAGSWTYDTSASIAYDDSASTIDAALEAVIGGFMDTTVIVKDSRLIVSFESTNKSLLDAITDSDFDLSGLTPAGRVSLGASTSSGLGYYYRLATIYPATSTYNTSGAHSLTTGDKGYLRTADGFSEFVEVTVDDTDTFTAANTVNIAEQTSITEFSVSGFYYVRSKPIPCRWVYQYFIPGVTTGITTAADIPRLDVRDYDFGLYKAVVDQDESAYISVGEIEQPYPGLLVRVAVQIDISDLFD